jgi:hypothetical protein
MVALNIILKIYSCKLQQAIVVFAGEGDNTLNYGDET